MSVAIALGCAWGGIAAAPFVACARRRRVASRVDAFRVRRRSPRPTGWRLLDAPCVAPTFRVVTSLRRVRRARRARAEVLAAVPVSTDLAGVAVAAGCTPYQAVQLAARWGPPAAASHLTWVTDAVALGSSFDDVLRELATRAPPLRAFADALRTSARLGAPIGPALARLADEVRADVRRRAEARARTVAVRLCFPLVACILPAFALITVVPVVLDGFRR